MGVLDKVKKILFDYEDVEVPISSDELPERQNKKVEESPKSSNTHFIDHGVSEEDTIKEIKVPEEDENETRIKFPIDDFEDIEPMPSRSVMHETVEEVKEERRVVVPQVEERPREYHREPSMQVSDLKRNIESPTREVHERVEAKDYKKILESENANGKKPFKPSPVISPVFGILDKNYKPEEVTEKREMISKVNTGVKPRMFGPVSYNDKPLPTPHTHAKTTLKEDLSELNATVNDIISDTIRHDDVKEEELDMPAYASNEVSQDDDILVTENYDEITSGIENEYLGNNNNGVEDAFEPTSEFDRITEQDNNASKEVEEDSDTKEIPSYNVTEEKTETDDNENLEDTIETDLFHLIDSMYQSKEEDSEEEE